MAGSLLSVFPGILQAVNEISEVIKVLNLVPAEETWFYSYVESDRNPEDVLVFERNVLVERKFLKQQTIEIPYQGPKEITCIEVENKVLDGSGGKVRIKSGGMGQKYANIILQSQLSRGLDFTIKIWAKC